MKFAPFEWTRAIREAPAIRNDNDTWTNVDSGQLLKLIAYDPTASGVTVTPQLAMRVSAVYACVRILGGAIASLPFHLYEAKGDGVRERLPKSDLWYYLNEQPSTHWTAAAMWEFVVGSILLYGDGFVWIRRRFTGSNAIAELVPINPASVSVVHDDKVGRMYTFANGGTIASAYAADMLHFPGLGFDGSRSLSVIQWAGRNAIGSAFQTDQFAGRFFANGATPPVVIRAPGKMQQEQIDKLRALWSEKVGGSANAHLPLILTEGLEAKELKVSAVDAQMLETRQFNVEDICRAFGVPPFMVGAQEKTTSWGSGVEAMSIGFVRYTLQPHLRRIEQELNRKLFLRAPRFVEASVEGLLRGDAKARSDFYRQAIGGSQGPGWMTANEIRSIENLPPIEGGDERFTPNAAAEPAAPGNGQQEDDENGQTQPGAAGDDASDAGEGSAIGEDEPVEQ